MLEGAAAEVCPSHDQPCSPADAEHVANRLYSKNLPLFYPILDRARVIPASIQRITGDNTARLVQLFPQYVSSGFDAAKNSGEVVLEVIDASPPVLQYGASAAGDLGRVDQAGGLSSPDIKVVGFSRKSGPVGGTPPASGAVNTSLQVYSTGTFSPADFFGGLTSAKLLGAVKLSDILQPLLGGLDSNLGDAPRMVEQGLVDFAGDVEKVATIPENDAISLIQVIQTKQIDSPAGKIDNPLATRLAAQTQAVLDARSVRDQTDHKNTLDSLWPMLHLFRPSSLTAAHSSRNYRIPNRSCPMRRSASSLTL